MPCYHPLQAFRDLIGKTESGKALLTFRAPSGPYEELKLPCGQCIGCRLDRSRDWALRCMHEASLYNSNCFLTLTYDDENLPADGSLKKRDYQTFLKRLRERFNNYRIRYFLCGEYGTDLLRPHYHALLFNHDFVDKVQWSTSKGNTIYRSPELEELWPQGYAWIGEVTWQSAAYVARYVIKKVNGEHAHQRYVQDVDTESGECRYLEPEFISMSRRPGIARDWYRRYKSDCRKDFLTHEGNTYKVPKYYDRILELQDEQTYNQIKSKRKEMAKQNAPDRLRLRAMEKHKLASAKHLKRSI